MSRSDPRFSLALCGALLALLISGCDTSDASSDDAFVSFRVDDRTIRTADISGFTAGDVNGTYLIATLPQSDEPFEFGISFDSTGVAQFVYPAPNRSRHPVEIVYGHPVGADGPEAQYRLSNGGSGTVDVRRYDRSSGWIEGQFEAVLVRTIGGATDTVRIREGRFRARIDNSHW